MKKEIKLMTRYGSLCDREPFLLGVGDALELEFISPYRLDSAVVTLSYAGKKQSFRFSGNTFRVPEEFHLSEGKLCVELALVKNGRKEMRWDIEPILLREYEGRIEAMPHISELQAEIAELKAKEGLREKEFQTFKTAVLGQIKTLIENHNKLIEQVEILQSEQAL